MKRPITPSNTLVKHVRVDRSRTPEEIFRATGKVLDLDRVIMEYMPRGEGEDLDIVFCKVERVGFDQVGAAVGEFGLEALEDPIALASFNEANPEFADEHHNATQWKNINGFWFYADFRWGNVRVALGGGFWHDPCWFLCVRK